MMKWEKSNLVFKVEDQQQILYLYWEIYWKRLEFGLKTVIVLLDIKKAYDIIERDLIWTALKRMKYWIQLLEE